jgi:hypothetical protein
LLIAALARQVGILHERIAPAGALTLHQKVSLGEKATPMTLADMNGLPIAIGGTRAARSQLLFFASPDCPMCKSLLPIVRSAARAEASWLDIVVAGDGGKPREFPRRVLAACVARRALQRQPGLGGAVEQRFEWWLQRRLPWRPARCRCTQRGHGSRRCRPECPQGTTRRGRALTPRHGRPTPANAIQEAGVRRRDS